MKYIIIKDCKTCPNRHLDIRYFSCHRDRESGWWCNKVNKLIIKINNLDIKELPENVIPDWCPLDDCINEKCYLKINEGYKRITTR